MGNNKDFTFLILSLIFGFIIGFIFFLLSFNNRLIITLISSCLLFIVSIIIIVILRQRNKLSLSSSLYVLVPYLLVALSVYVVEYKSQSWEVIYISKEYIHLGDKELKWFTPNKPLKEIFFTKKFELPINPRKAKLAILVKDVDPDFRSGPALVVINEGFSFFLNNQKPFSDISPEEEHETGFQSIEVPIPVGFLNQGENTLSIYVLPTIYGLDDINLSEIKLFYK